jgi:carboxypeptidase C (cathepsin A)
VLIIQHSYYDFTCTRKGGVEPILSIETCKSLRTWRDRCLKWLKIECRDTYDSDGCMTAANVCDEEFTTAFFETGRNPYNVEDLCLAGYEPNLCYANTEDIRAYMDREDVRELLGAEPVSHIGKFQSCNSDVARGFGFHNDQTVQNVDYVAGLLERGIDVLIYVGKLDW